MAMVVMMMMMMHSSNMGCLQENSYLKSNIHYPFIIFHMSIFNVTTLFGWSNSLIIPKQIELSFTIISPWDFTHFCQPLGLAILSHRYQRYHAPYSNSKKIRAVEHPENLVNTSYYHT